MNSEAVAYQIADFLPSGEDLQTAWIYARLENPAVGVGHYMLTLNKDRTANRDLFYGGDAVTPATHRRSDTTWELAGARVTLGDGGSLSLLEGEVLSQPDMRWRLIDTVDGMPLSLVSDPPAHAWALDLDSNLYRSTGTRTAGTFAGVDVTGFLNIDIDRGPVPFFEGPTIAGRPYDWLTFREEGGRWGSLLEIQTADGPLRAGFVALPWGASVTARWAPHRHHDALGVSDGVESYAFPISRLLLHLPDFWWWDAVMPTGGVIWWEHGLKAR